MMTTDCDILLKNHVTYNFKLKCYITILLRQFMETLNQCLDLSWANQNLEICMTIFFQGLNESNQFRAFFE